MTDQLKLNYQFPPVTEKYVFDFHSKVALLGGPVGTGKTFATGSRIMTRIGMMRPCRNIIKYSLLLARTTKGDVQHSIVKDIEEDIFPPGFIEFAGQYPMEAVKDFKLENGVHVHMEIMAIGAENQEEMEKKTKSLRFTDAAAIEAQKFTPGMLHQLFERRSRSPSDKDGGINFDVRYADGTKNTYHHGQLFGDFNMTSRQHPFFDYCVRKNSGQRSIYLTPPMFNIEPDNKGAYFFRGERCNFIDNPDAEPYTFSQLVRDDKGKTIPGSGFGYWRDLADQWHGDDIKIQKEVMADWADESQGKPVYPVFKFETHVADVEMLPHNNRRPILCGVDNGLNNSWVFFQEDDSGRLNGLLEINNVLENAKPVDTAIQEDVLPAIRQYFYDRQVIFIVDPAMNTREGRDGLKQLDLFNDYHMKYEIPDHETVAGRIVHGSWFIGTPQALLLSKNMTDLANSLAGGYRYKMKKNGMYNPKPEKDEYSHNSNAFEFVASYMRGGNRLNMEEVYRRKTRRKPFKFA